MTGPEAGTLSRAQARALLAFYVRAGVTDAVADTPVDRFALGDAPPPRLARSAAAAAMLRPAAAAPGPAATSGSGAGATGAPASRMPRGRELPAPGTGSARQAPPSAGGGFDTGAGPAVAEATVEAARELAASASSLDELRTLLAAFEDCPLRLTAKNLVFADGNPEADLMLVGEAPGREEDERGLPFVGRSGQLLDRMLAAIGRDRTSVYITNVIPWRPPANRTPSPVEVETCRPFAVRHIELVRPKVLVCLGGASAKLLLGTSEGIKRLRGHWRDYDAGGTTIAAVATLHPAYLLRTPIDKRLAWRDLLAISDRLDTATGAGGRCRTSSA